MIRRPPRSTRTDHLCPNTTRCGSAATRAGLFELRSGDLALQRASRDAVRAYARAVLADQAEARARLLAMAAAKSRAVPSAVGAEQHRSEEHTSELQSLMRISYAVFCLTKKRK